MQCKVGARCEIGYDSFEELDQYPLCDHQRYQRIAKASDENPTVNAQVKELVTKSLKPFYNGL